MAFELPNDFRCPISLEIMSDPVIIESGHTFDRVSIKRWIDSGNRTCPITNLPLSENPSLIPNHALRSLISVVYQHSRFPIVVQCLKARVTNPTRPTHETDSSIRRKVTESGAVRAALDCVDSNNQVLQEKSLSLLLNLSLEDDNKVGLVADGMITRIVAVLRVGSPDCKAVAATLLTSLAVVEVNKDTIGSYPDAISALVSLLRQGNNRERKESATALLRRLLVKYRGGREEMSKVNGFVLRNGSSRGIQYSLFMLNCLCCCGPEIVDKVKLEGVVHMHLFFLSASWRYALIGLLFFTWGITVHGPLLTMNLANLAMILPFNPYKNLVMAIGALFGLEHGPHLRPLCISL